MVKTLLGKKLQQLRRGAGLTQQELANRAKVSLSTVSKIEEGAVTRPSAKILAKLVRVLKSDLDLLMNDQPLPKYLTRPLTKPAANESARATIKFVYFDVGGVLAHTESILLQQLAARFDRPLAQVQAVYHLYVPLAFRGKLTMEDLQYLFLLKLNIRYRAAKRRDLFRDWVDDMQLNQPVHEFAKSVAHKYPLGLLTNILPGLLKRMQRQRLVPNLRYKTIVQSCYVGAIKPEPAIYEFATKQAGVKPSEILFIDDQKVNVKGARAYGWQAEWFNELKTEASIARLRRKYFV